MQQTFRGAFSPASKLRTREVRRQAEALRRVRRLAAQAELRQAVLHGAAKHDVELCRAAARGWAAQP